MPPVTRSAAHAAEQSTSKTNKRKARTTKATKAKAAQLSTSSAIRKAGESEISINYVAPRHRLLEWLSLKGIAGVAPDNGRLFSLLQELYLQKGCQVVARGRPRELIDIEWLVIEWKHSAAREEFLVSELFLKLEEALAPRLWKRELVWPIPGRAFGGVISVNPSCPPQKLYEILTVYVPADSDDTTVSSLENFRVSPHWHVEPDWEATEEPSAMAGFISQQFGWMEGGIEYHGRAARRLVYFFKFKDEEAERRYKETMMSGKVMEQFFENLQKLGMLGYESQHARFLEVVDYIPENAYFPLPPPLPLVVTLTAEEEAHFKKLDEWEGDL